MLPLGQGTQGWSGVGGGVNRLPRASHGFEPSLLQPLVESVVRRRSEKGEVGFLWEPQQPVSIPGAAWGQARVIIMPVVMVIVRADQMAVRGLLVVGDQVFVREPLNSPLAVPPGDLVQSVAREGHVLFSVNALGCFLRGFGELPPLFHPVSNEHSG